MITNKQAEIGITAIHNACSDLFRTTAINAEVERQLREGADPSDINHDDATTRADTLLKAGIVMRLNGAYQHYKDGNQLECIRHILLALGVICHVLKWDEAAQYLNRQNDVLFAYRDR